jgi:predicted N-acetyltransferase YhbS
MKRIIKSMEPNYLQTSLDLIETVFTEYDSPEEGELVRSLVKEIRSKRFYLPELELIMVDEDDHPIGYVMFSRFHLNGKYEDELLILTPVGVKTELQRQHISKELIEYGFSRAKDLGFTAVIVEGNPQNYRSRGFVTAADHGIMPGKSLQLPAIECLMVKELVPGALEHINGEVEYTDYETLK